MDGVKRKWEEICECVILLAGCQEDAMLARYEGRDYANYSDDVYHEYIRKLFTDGRTLIPDVDCSVCGGTGLLTGGQDDQGDVLPHQA